MNELPPDFPHDAPTGYRYETIPFTTTVDAIWTVSNRRFNYNDGDESRTIWGLSNTEARRAVRTLTMPPSAQIK